MKKYILLMGIALFSVNTQAQSLNDFMKKANNLLNGGGNKGNNNGNGSNGNSLFGNSLSNSQIVSGLKEALRIGTQNASQRLNLPNGFFGNQLIKILMPPEVQKIENTLRQFGFGSQCDKLILSLNRAAEDAAGKAVPIFVNAITSMSVTDGLSILRGGNNAATEFLKRSTTGALTQAFRPVIENSLGKVDATRYWNQIFTIYNTLPITKTKVNTDLTGYVTERALNGLFVNVAQEEANIRTNPTARVNDILRQVFGN
ncbi:MAG TPA: DUF4197 domain-containing protein [Chitinophagaceae bacterium]|nr:MAG: hypothetical protein UZ11_BCD004000754 [Bacteroidetes bacterium OLB11]HMN32549.1 DUF4197 domain-containing protein [Chitinophagaceae bacterium]